MESLLAAWPSLLTTLVLSAAALGCVARRPRPLGGPAAAAAARALHLQAQASAPDGAGVADEARAAGQAERAALGAEAPARSPRSGRGPRALAWVIAIALPVAAGALYLVLGTPWAVYGVKTNAVVEGTPVSVAELERHVRGHPQDARAWVLLARSQADAARFADAAQSYARAVTFAKVARDPGVWAEYADALGMTQGGRLAGRPEALIAEALQRDPRHPQALELAGSAAYERGDFGSATKAWRVLLDVLPADDLVRRAELENAIARAERQAATSLPARSGGTAP